MFGGSRAYKLSEPIKILYEAVYRILMGNFELGYPTECNNVLEAVSIASGLYQYPIQ